MLLEEFCFPTLHVGKESGHNPFPRIGGISEMAVAGCPAVDGSSEIQFLKDVGDIEIQDFAREITDDGIRLFLRPECVERDRNRLGSSDDVGDLDLTAACELGGNDIFCQEAAGVSSGTG